MIRRFILPLICLCVAMVAMAAEPVRVACIGNSITYGYGLQNRELDSYPSQLQRMLGQDYTVGNFGHSGATLLRHGHRPYNDLPEWKQAIDFRPDIAVMHLGINDTDPRNWPHYSDEFTADYMALIDSLRSVNPNVRILIARLSPIKATHHRFISGTRDWRLQIQDAIEAIALQSGAELIDFDTPLRDRQDLLPDGLHPNPEGATIMATEVYRALTGNYGGLQLPPVYQDGMVLQRNRPLTIKGIANAHKKVTVTIDGKKYYANSDNLGRWKVLTAPITSGKNYTLEVYTDIDTIRIKDILAGELWVAAGQSNMEFPLWSAVGGTDEMVERADTLIRFYDQHFVELTNAYVWPDSSVEKVDRLQYYLPSKWTTLSTAKDGYVSAVAWHFAKTLRDSLDVPVGIIGCAVGGSPIESWIDINTLEAELPQILVDWRGNDFLQPWVRQRIADNTTAPHRHPYEPSYLYSAAIRPLEGLPIAGAIWYQGESNAHNTEAHEQLFEMWTRSWRKAFGNGLPLIFVQLSSMERPSWAVFRDSQRRLAEKIPGVYMAVCSDKGHPTDVHPRDKRPVGERLARQALNHVYGMESVVPCGPEIVSAVAQPDGSVKLAMNHAESLRTSDGKEIRTFEVAETEGFYHPATATINSENEITLQSMEVKRPRYVRYGWQPYTTANLINADSLPASTFKVEVENAADFDMEPGLEYGVSAPFAGMISGKLLMVGGCNFPTADPFAAGATKKFYKGIYSADPQTMEWQRVGSLREAMAYGASVPMQESIILIGGTTAEGSLKDVYSLSMPDGKAQLAPLPSLPVAIDNMATAAIGSTIYVAGGNVDGTPSTALWAMDLSAERPQWKQLRSMPGNKRVQPVMAAAKDASGQMCLYVWGGFAGRHGKYEPTLELAGLKFNPQSGKWSPLPAPTDPEGELLASGGGAIATLSDGRIALTGGVNKDVFLGALKAQPADYLQHPIEWYRFNPYLLVFDPKTERWTVEEKNAETARAGAAMVAGKDTDFYLIGGELKPRIRTSQTLHISL